MQHLRAIYKHTLVLPAIVDIFSLIRLGEPAVDLAEFVLTTTTCSDFRLLKSHQDEQYYHSYSGSIKGRSQRRIDHRSIYCSPIQPEAIVPPTPSSQTKGNFKEEVTVKLNTK